MSRAPRSSATLEPERVLVRTVADHLTADGYRALIDPDGTDYFDLVARRGSEIGLVEVKVRDARAVLAQALRRRGWGDWNAVALGSERSAMRLAERTRGTRAESVGIWCLVGGAVRVVRPAARWVAAPESDPYASLRERFRRWLDLVEEVGGGSAVRWSGVPGAVRRASGGRAFAEWRLDEPDAPRS